MKSKLFVALIILLVFVSSAYAQTTESPVKNYALGQEFKATIGELIYIGEDLQIQVTQIGTDSEPMKVTLSVSHMLYDVAAKQLILGVNERGEYLNYVVEVTSISSEFVSLRVSRMNVPGVSPPVQGNPEIYVNLEDIFEAKQGYTIYYDDELIIYVKSVAPEISMAAANTPELVLLVRNKVQTTDSIGTEVSFSVRGEKKNFNDFVISYEKRSGESVFLKLSKITNPTIRYVSANEEFKANMGDIFNLENEFIIELKDIIYSQGVIFDYVVLDITETSDIGRRYPYLNIKNSETASLGKGYSLTVLSMDSNSAKFVAKKISVATITDTGISVISPGGEEIQVIELYMKDYLGKDVEFTIDSQGINKIIRVQQQTQKETTIEENGVNVKTMLNVQVDNEGISVINDDGSFYRVKVLPVVASEKAREALNKNFDEIELKEVKGKIVYSAETTKNYKILGFIKANGKASVDIDAQTAQILRTKKPWYSGISSDADKV